MTRIRAFATHFLLSLLIVSLVLTVVLAFWYPTPYFQIVGTTDALKILICVDLVLGPLLTLVLFKPGKKGLLFDMACIAVMQISALAYGVSILHEERPYFAVFAQDRFEVLAYKDIVHEQLDSGITEKPLRGPGYVVATMPDDKAEWEKAFEDILFHGQPDIQYQPRFWTNYADRSELVVKNAKPLSHLIAANPQAEQDVQAIVARFESADQLGFVPVIGKKQPFAMVVDKTSRKPVDIIDADPFRKPPQLARTATQMVKP